MNARGAIQLDGFLSVADDDNFLFDQQGTGGTAGGPSFHILSAGDQADAATHSGHGLIDALGAGAAGGGHFGAPQIEIHDSSAAGQLAFASVTSGAADLKGPHGANAFSGLDDHDRGGGGDGRHGGHCDAPGLVTTYTSGNPCVPDAHEFNIQVNFAPGNWTVGEQAVVKWAADFWSNIITHDVHDDTDLAGNLVDDIAITILPLDIDQGGGPLGNVLAFTTNFVVRDPGAQDQLLPLEATIVLDAYDLADPALADSWDTTILHEMGHALGFLGPIFDFLGLIDGGNFVGRHAAHAYGGPVPLSPDGSHWDEASFAPRGRALPNELMTGFVVPGEQTYLSDTTIAALQDLGYHVHDPSHGRSALLVDSGLVV